MNVRNVLEVGRFLWEIASRLDRENRQSMMSWPIEAHRRSAIYEDAVAINLALFRDVHKCCLLLMR